MLEDKLGIVDGIAGEEVMELVTEFGGDDPVFTIVVDGFADEFFREMIAIAFSGVDEIDTTVFGRSEHVVDFGLLEVFAPFPAELPCADTHNGNVHISFAKSTVFHDWSFYFNDVSINISS